MNNNCNNAVSTTETTSTDRYEKHNHNNDNDDNDNNVMDGMINLFNSNWNDNNNNDDDDDDNDKYYETVTIGGFKSLLLEDAIIISSSDVVLSSTLPQQVVEDDDKNGISSSSSSTSNTSNNATTSNLLSFRVQIPYDPIGTLFCDQIWSGSKLLGHYISKYRELYATNKCTIELGAGTALPSLTALACHSTISIITDYPDPIIIQSINDTVTSNWKECHNPINRVAVLGYEWGQSIEPIQSKLQQLLLLEQQQQQRLQDDVPSDKSEIGINTNTAFYFDVAYISECLWMHRCHEALVQSLHELVCPVLGIIIVTYAHHIPGMEDADNNFFTIAENIGSFITIVHEIYNLPYMWDTSKLIPIHLRVLQRKKEK